MPSSCSSLTSALIQRESALVMVRGTAAGGSLVSALGAPWKNTL